MIPLPLATTGDRSRTHRERHELLHAAFDELMADYFAHHRHARPSNTTLYDVLVWSRSQTVEPAEQDGDGFLPEIAVHAHPFGQVPAVTDLAPQAQDTQPGG